MACMNMLWYFVCVFTLLALLGGGAVCAGVRARRRMAARRRAFGRTALPAHWEEILRRRVPCYARLPEEERTRVHAWMKIFLAEKSFVACGGLRCVNDAMALAIAGNACLLLAGREAKEGGCFPSVSSVLVYPHVFCAPTRALLPGAGAEIVSTETRAGEAAPWGTVVVAWREVLAAGAFAGNGSNVVLHEFAHHVRPSGKMLPEVIEAGWRRLCAEDDRAGVLDAYGAESREEFWAVAVEAFFEDSTRLRDSHGELYAALAAFLALDPAKWAPG